MYDYIRNIESFGAERAHLSAKNLILNLIKFDNLFKNIILNNSKIYFF